MEAPINKSPVVVCALTYFKQATPANTTKMTFFIDCFKALKNGMGLQKNKPPMDINSMA